ncbi:MAG: peptidoglycan DD-metalloendopeptidase family protein [Deltaproteobacteria bacterium]|nr:peptidoglycan DD-metalloendopeptidase family protein [Deltaproteobacteria bacterium]MBW2418564.1 peptidoglycan DD-metalloendopeptidase family protein [Deltaproteobacteria bacterium]
MRIRGSVSLRRLGEVALLASLALGSADAQEEGREAELGRLREAISDTRERVGKHERRERELFERLEEIDRSLERLRAQVAIATGDAKEAAAALLRLEGQRTQIAARLAQTQRSMAIRAVALYKTGEIGPLRLVFSSGSLPELITRASVLRTLLEHDSNLVGRFRAERAQLEATEREARQALTRRDETAEALREHTQELAAEKDKKSVLLASARKDRGAERALLVELEKAARALEETMAALGDEPGRRGRGLENADFASRRGSLPSPVAAGISQRFGRVVDAQYQTETIRKGVEFAAAPGDSVRAVAFGEVRFAGWFRGYGKIVILDHGDRYFSVMGHLAEIFVEVGTMLDTGETLGSVGETGSLKGPSLYFELRRGSEPLDPAEWLELGQRS